MLVWYTITNQQIIQSVIHMTSRFYLVTHASYKLAVIIIIYISLHSDIELKCKNTCNEYCHILIGLCKKKL